MRFRHVRSATGLQIQERNDGPWQPLNGPSPFGESPFSDAWQLSVADRHLQLTDELLPFAPLSLRDFLLSEQHNVDATRGMLRRFYPRTYRLTRYVEATTRRPFASFAPKPLFYRQPIYYFGNAMTIVPSGTPIAFPSYSRGLDSNSSWPGCSRRRRTTPRRSRRSTRSAPSCCSATSAHVTCSATRWAASRDEHLLPGEVFATGTLPGGSGMETGHWLSPGDTLRLVLDGIGEVEHRVVSSLL